MLINNTAHTGFSLGLMFGGEASVLHCMCAMLDMTIIVYTYMWYPVYNASSAVLEGGADRYYMV